MKYYFCYLTECNGEHEYTHKFLLKSDKIEEAYDNITKWWFAEDAKNIEPDELGLIWAADGRAISVKDGYHIEVTEDEFKILNKYLSCL